MMQGLGWEAGVSSEQLDEKGVFSNLEERYSSEKLFAVTMLTGCEHRM